VSIRGTEPTRAAQTASRRPPVSTTGDRAGCGGPWGHSWPSSRCATRTPTPACPRNVSSLVRSRTGGDRVLVVKGLHRLTARLSTPLVGDPMNHGLVHRGD
jgi:hypothetical protein